MGSQFYLTVTGRKQGQFKSESTEPGRKDKWIPALGFEMAVEAPHDPQSGLPTGKRRYSPVRIVKEWGAASPQALTALATNEVLTNVTMQFVRAAADGIEATYQTCDVDQRVVPARGTGERGRRSGWRTTRWVARSLPRESAIRRMNGKNGPSLSRRLCSTTSTGRPASPMTGTPRRAHSRGVVRQYHSHAGGATRLTALPPARPRGSTARPSPSSRSGARHPIPHPYRH